MGYSTEFKGELKFTQELKASQIAKVQAFLSEDCKDHPEWGNHDLYYVDLEFLPDFSGLQWNGSEKTYGMVEVVNMIIENMRESMPSFGLEGSFVAQGEDVDDRWELIFENGLAVKKNMPHTGSKVTCPHCEQHFYI